jgi:hypothetical protein
METPAHDYLELSRLAEVVFRYIQKSKKFAGLSRQICGLSRGDMHEKSATAIHYGGGIIAARCRRRLGARDENG